jgi:hypothetical protein
MYLLICIPPLITGFVCEMFLCSRDDERQIVAHEKFTYWLSTTPLHTQRIYAFTQGCYVTAFIAALLTSSFAKVFAWEIVFILPMLVVCATLLEHLFGMSQCQRHHLHYTLRTETVFIFLLILACLYRYPVAWPLHLFNAVAFYHNIVSEKSFYLDTLDLYTTVSTFSTDFSDLSEKYIVA